MKKAWKWLSGKKTVFGLTILTLLEQGLVDESTLPYVILQILGWTLTGVGVTHKLAKGDETT